MVRGLKESHTEEPGLWTCCRNSLVPRPPVGAGRTPQACLCVRAWVSEEMGDWLREGLVCWPLKNTNCSVSQCLFEGVVQVGRPQVPACSSVPVGPVKRCPRAPPPGIICCVVTLPTPQHWDGRDHDGSAVPTAVSQPGISAASPQRRVRLQDPGPHSPNCKDSKM